MLPTHEYLRRILLGHPHGLFEAASVSHLVIAHDQGCGIYSGALCDCDPTITLQARGRRLELLADGTVRDLGACQ